MMHFHFHPIHVTECDIQVSQLAQATVETSRRARWEIYDILVYWARRESRRGSRRGQEKAAKEKAVRR